MINITEIEEAKDLLVGYLINEQCYDRKEAIRGTNQMFDVMNQEVTAERVMADYEYLKSIAEEVEHYLF